MAEALTDLRAKPGVVVRVEGHWTIAEERKEFVMWSFAPAGHPAYPAIIKRNLYEHWLDPKQSDLGAMYAILDDRERPYYEHRLAA